MNNYEEQLKEELKIIDKDNRTLQQENIYLREKIKLLQSIIKEVREYIESKVVSSNEVIDQLRKSEVRELLEILDKE